MENNSFIMKEYALLMIFLNTRAYACMYEKYRQNVHEL